MRRLALVLLLCLCLEGAGFAQPSASPLTDDASHPVRGIIVLAAPWRFHSGDNPQWESSTFDDSSWNLHLFEKSWAEQGLPGFSGYAWLWHFAAEGPLDELGDIPATNLNQDL